MSWYSTKVERDVARWQSAGWVSETGAASIRADLAAHRSAVGAPGILAVLGAVLFGFAVMSFVAANWSAMSKLARLAVLLGALWGFYGGAAWLFTRRLDAFAHAAVLGGIAVYGASIMLIAQMYHMDGNAPDAILAWGLGGLLAALLLRSNAALAATFVLLAVWSGWERWLSWDAHWLFLGPWAAAAAVAVWLGWRPGLHLAALSLTFWLAPLGYYVLDRHAHWVVAAIGAAMALAATALGERGTERRLRVSQVVFAYGVVAAFAGLFTMQFIDDRAVFGTLHAQPIGRLAALAALTLALLVAAMYRALVSDNRGALWLGYIAFALQIGSVYWKMLGTLLNTSLFFLLAALIVSILAWAAYRLHQRQTPSREAVA